MADIQKAVATEFANIEKKTGKPLHPLKALRSTVPVRYRGLAIRAAGRLGVARLDSATVLRAQCA